MCTSRTGPSNALIASMIPAEVKEKPTGLMMDGVGVLARGGRNQPLPPYARGVSAAKDARCSHPKGINGLLTITIY